MGRRAKPKVYEGEAEFLFDWYIFAFNMAGVLEYIGNAGEPVSAEVVKRIYAERDPLRALYRKRLLRTADGRTVEGMPAE